MGGSNRKPTVKKMPPPKVSPVIPMPPPPRKISPVIPMPPPPRKISPVIKLPLQPKATGLPPYLYTVSTQSDSREVYAIYELQIKSSPQMVGKRYSKTMESSNQKPTVKKRASPPPKVPPVMPMLPPPLNVPPVIQRPPPPPNVPPVMPMPPPSPNVSPVILMPPPPPKVQPVIPMPPPSSNVPPVILMLPPPPKVPPVIPMPPPSPNVPPGILMPPPPPKVQPVIPMPLPSPNVPPVILMPPPPPKVQPVIPMPPPSPNVPPVIQMHPPPPKVPPVIKLHPQPKATGLPKYLYTESTSQSNSRTTASNISASTPLSGTAILSPAHAPKAPVLPISSSSTIPLSTSTRTSISASNASSLGIQSQSRSNISSSSQINFPQSPNDIGANRVVHYDANSYIIPNVEISTEIGRPFDFYNSGWIKTDRFVLLVCSKYMSREGCHLKYCFRFHVCYKWIRDNCKDECSFEHSFHGKDNSTLFDRIISPNFREEELKKRLRRNLFYKKDYKENPYYCICMDFILKQCNKQDCESHHIGSLYSWELHLNNPWYQFSKRQNEEIEKNFCNPAVSSFTLDSNMPRDRNEKTFRTDLAFPNESITIDFQNMSLTTSNQTFCRIKRLSTPSDVTIFKTVATRWLWYYKDSDDIWKFYTNAYANDYFIFPFSDYIEIQFLKNIHHFTFKCSTSGVEYTINFEDMSQTNSYTGIKHEIRRRPMPSYSNAKWKKDTKIIDLWTNLNGKEKYLLQEVSKESPEFYFIKNMIASSLPLLEIFIKRVENSYLWKAYQLKKPK